jgi:hypothetical protein
VIAFFREIAARLKDGFPIGEGYRLRTLGVDGVVVSKDGHEISFEAERAPEPGVVRKIILSRINGNDREIVIPLIISYFERSGKVVVVHDEE